MTAVNDSYILHFNTLCTPLHKIIHHRHRFDCINNEKKNSFFLKIFVGNFLLGMAFQIF